MDLRLAHRFSPIFTDRHVDKRVSLRVPLTLLGNAPKTAALPL